MENIINDIYVSESSYFTHIQKMQSIYRTIKKDVC